MNEVGQGQLLGDLPLGIPEYLCESGIDVGKAIVLNNKDSDHGFFNEKAVFAFGGLDVLNQFLDPFPPVALFLEFFVSGKVFPAMLCQHIFEHHCAFLFKILPLLVTVL